MRFLKQQIVLVGTGLAVATAAWSGAAYAPDIFVSAEPRPRGPDLSEALSLVAALCLLIAGHRYLGRRVIGLLSYMQSQALYSGEANYHASIWQAYLHVDENGKDLDA
jgi:hypothetical protein